MSSPEKKIKIDDESQVPPLKSDHDPVLGPRILPPPRPTSAS
jgi:hypothetical protein